MPGDGFQITPLSLCVFIDVMVHAKVDPVSQFLASDHSVTILVDLVYKLAKNTERTDVCTSLAKTVTLALFPDGDIYL